jgi:hypothetical protein
MHLHPFQANATDAKSQVLHRLWTGELAAFQRERDTSARQVPLGREGYAAETKRPDKQIPLFGTNENEACRGHSRHATRSEDRFNPVIAKNREHPEKPKTRKTSDEHASLPALRRSGAPPPVREEGIGSTQQVVGALIADPRREREDGTSTLYFASSCPLFRLRASGLNHYLLFLVKRL